MDTSASPAFDAFAVLLFVLVPARDFDELLVAFLRVDRDLLDFFVDDAVFFATDVSPAGTGRPGRNPERQLPRASKDRLPTWESKTIE